MQEAPFGCLVAGRPLDTNFTVLSPTHMRAEVSDLGEARHVTVFAINPPPLPDGAVFSVYLQRGSQPPVFVGAICPGSLSLTTAPRKSVGHQDGSYSGFVHVLIQEAAEVQDLVLQGPAGGGDSRPTALLSRIAEKMLDDLERYLSSHEDVEVQGQHYVNAAAVDAWLSSFDTRIRMNGRFWADIE